MSFQEYKSGNHQWPGDHSEWPGSDFQEDLAESSLFSEMVPEAFRGTWSHSDVDL